MNSQYENPYLVTGKDLRAGAKTSRVNQYFDCHFTCPVCNRVQKNAPDWFDSKNIERNDFACNDCKSRFILDESTKSNCIEEKVWVCCPTKRK